LLEHFSEGSKVSCEAYAYETCFELAIKGGKCFRSLSRA